MEEYRYEENLHKKLKKGKITQEEFDKLINNMNARYEH